MGINTGNDHSNKICVWTKKQCIYVCELRSILISHPMVDTITNILFL